MTPIVLAALAALAVAVPAAAQPRPGAELGRSREIREQQRMEQRLPRTTAVPEEAVVDETRPGEVPAPTPDSSLRFTLTEVRVSPSEILSSQEVEALTRPLVGRNIGFDDLTALVAAFNTLYRDKGFVTARAILPPQTIRGGVVDVRLLEARVGALSLEGNISTRDAYIVDRLSFVEGDLLRLDRLERELFYFNSLNDIDLRAVLKPGETPLTTDVVVRALEPPPRELRVYVDNAGREDIGEHRLGVDYVERSLLGRRDQLSLGAYGAEGTRGYYASYNLPLGTAGTRLGLSYDRSFIDIVDGPLEPLDISGSSYRTGVFVTHPLHVQRGLVVNLFAGMDRSKSNTDFGEVTLVESRVRTVTLGLDAQGYRPRATWYSRHTLSKAPQGWDNSPDFLRYKGELSWYQRLAEDSHLLLRARAQLADSDLLPASQQFQLGGSTSVRGYPEGLLIGDDGYFVSVEYNRRLATGHWGQWRGLVFLDHGGAFPFRGAGEGSDADDFLTSAGLGTTLDLGRRLSLRMTAGVPLSQRDDGEDDARLHFYVQLLPL